MRFELPMASIIALFFLAVFVIAAVVGWEWPYIAKLMPIYVVAIPGIVLCLVQIYRDVTRLEERRGATPQGMDMDEGFIEGLDTRTEVRRTVAFFSWFAGGALALWLIGIVMALPLLVFFYAAAEGREKWLVSLLMAAGVFLLIWGLFEYAFEMKWPPGILFR